ncbi:hypothetical protein [Streptomyces sp. NPDC057677]
MPEQAYPERVRLHGGRNVHAAQPIDTGHITACAIYIDRGAQNTWLPSDAPVACRRCTRDLVRKREASA